MPRVALREFVEPIFDRGQVLTFLAAVVGLALVLRTASPAEVRMQTAAWTMSAEAFGLALAIWALISLIRSPLIVVREDRRRGRWHEHRFAFHDQRLVAAERFDPVNGALQVRMVKFVDAEPGSAVYFSIGMEPPIRVLAYAGLAPYGAEIGPATPVPEMHDGHGGWAIWLDKKRRANLVVRFEPNARSVMCRVYSTGFYMG
jgi:hypothetical protein